MEAVRVYGDIHGLNEEGFEKVMEHMPFDQIKYADQILNVDYEGQYIDVEDFLEAVAENMNQDGWGMVDYIDQIEWELTRYRIKKGSYEFNRISVDQALDSPFNS